MFIIIIVIISSSSSMINMFIIVCIIISRSSSSSTTIIIIIIIIIITRPWSGSWRAWSSAQARRSASPGATELLNVYNRSCYVYRYTVIYIRTYIHMCVYMHIYIYMCIEREREKISTLIFVLWKRLQTDAEQVSCNVAEFCRRYLFELDKGGVLVCLWPRQAQKR